MDYNYYALTLECFCHGVWSLNSNFRTFCQIPKRAPDSTCRLPSPSVDRLPASSAGPSPRPDLPSNSQHLEPFLWVSNALWNYWLHFLWNGRPASSGSECLLWDHSCPHFLLLLGLSWALKNIFLPYSLPSSYIGKGSGTPKLRMWRMVSAKTKTPFTQTQFSENPTPIY